MKKIRIFDIIPPREIKLSQVREPKHFTFLSCFHLFKKRFFTGLVVFLLFALLIFFFLPSKAEIEILPKKETLNLGRAELKINTLIEEITFESIPGKIVQTEEFLSQEFSATGKTFKEERARGIIRVYNTYSLSPQALIPNTRFVSAEGKLFRSPEKVVIPGEHYEAGKLVPGFVDIEVIADQAGPEYNIGPSTFSLPGLSGTVMYTAIYAKSFQNMKGGSREEVSEITKNDLEKASGVLEVAIKEKVESSLKRKIPEDFILIKDAQVFERGEISLLSEAGEKKSSFWGETKAKGAALIFKKSDFNQWALNFIQSVKISDKKEVKKDSLTHIFRVKSADLKGGKMLLEVEISAQIFSKIDEKILKELIKGKKEKDVEQTILENYPEISEIRLKLFPFWLRKIPKDDRLLEIKLQI